MHEKDTSWHAEKVSRKESLETLSMFLPYVGRSIILIKYVQVINVDTQANNCGIIDLK